MNRCRWPRSSTSSTRPSNARYGFGGLGHPSDATERRSSLPASCDELASACTDVNAVARKWRVGHDGLMIAARPPVEIQGLRVVVRRYCLADAVELHQAIVDSVEHLAPWMPWAAFEPLELSDRERLITGWLERWEQGEDFNFGVFEEGLLVGGCGLHRRIGPNALELGYWTRAGATGRGVASDTARCLVEGAFSMAGVDYVEVHHDAANVASRRIPERLGFSFVEEREDIVAAPAEVGLDWVWRLDRRDWSKHHQARAL
jgi:ribosomal-protein-serine acetyltransferase